MKKLLVIVLVFITSNIFAQDFMKTKYAFEVAYLPTASFVNYEYAPTLIDNGDGSYSRFVIPDISSYTNDFKFLFTTEFIFFNFLFIGGRLGTTFRLRADETYALAGSPTFMESLFFAGLRYKNIELGFQRFCNHPVVPNGQAKELISVNGESSFGKIYLRIQGEL